MAGSRTRPPQGLLAEPDALAATAISTLGVALGDLRGAIEAALPPPARSRSPSSSIVAALAAT